MMTKDEKIARLSFENKRLDNFVTEIMGANRQLIKERDHLQKTCERYRLRFHQLRQLLGFKQ